MTVPFVLSGDPRPLVIDEGPYAGAELTVLTDVPLGVTSGIGRLMVAFGEADAGSADEETAIRRAWAEFVDAVLVGWNVFDRRGAIPIDQAAFARIPPRFATTIISAWADLMLPPAEEP